MNTIISKMLKGFWLGLIIGYASSLAYGQQIIEADICVYGGTSAGVIAAYTSKTLGKNAILIEPGKNLGGMSSGGLGYTDIGNKFAITGLARDFYRRIGKHYGKFEQWIFEPHVAEDIFKDYARRGGFQILFQTRIKEVVKKENSIREIILDSKSDSGLTQVIVRAKMYIDTSYEGDLMAKAGVPYRVGREANAEYGETFNGVQLLDGHQFPDGIDPYRIPGKPSSGLLWGIGRDTLKSQGSSDEKVQAYNYRICLSGEPDNRIPITRPSDYDSSRYELLLRLFAATPDKRKLNDYFIWSRMPNNKTDINNRGGFSTDMIGMNYNYPDGDFAEREKIVKAHESYTKGLLYFYGHDERVPLKLREEMSMWGYPKDEYTGNGNWSHQLYIREARRLTGAYVMTQHNCEGKRKIHDGIGLAAYTMDSHNCQRIVVNGQVRNEGNVEVGGFGPYPVSYRAIIPWEEDATNLFVPVCLSATHIAYGSIRMEPVFMVLAQSAATAATMAIDENIPVQHVNIRSLQNSLRLNPLADSTPPDILADNDDARHVSRSTKRWRVKKEGGYGKTFFIFDPSEKKLLDSKNEKIERVRFHGNALNPGLFNIYMYVPKVANSTEYMAVRISDGVKTTERVIRIGGLLVEGQTAGEWVSLGQQAILKKKRPWVEVSTKGANGYVVADAVIWTPVTNGLAATGQ